MLLQELDIANKQMLNTAFATDFEVVFETPFVEKGCPKRHQLLIW